MLRRLINSKNDNTLEDLKYFFYKMLSPLKIEIILQWNLLIFMFLLVKKKKKKLINFENNFNDIHDFPPSLNCTSLGAYTTQV
jgi:hypothetical protein